MIPHLSRFLPSAFFGAALFCGTLGCDCDTRPPAGGERSSTSTASRRESLAERSFRLPNGLEVDLVTGPCGDTAALVVLFEVGIDHDPPGRSGMAHVVERLLSTRAAGRAATTAQTGSDHTVYSVVVPGDQLLEELDEAAARMARLELTEADLGRARAHVLEDLTRLHGGDATRTAMSYAGEAVQPARGHGRRGGIAAEVEAIELAELEAFWQAHFKPANARIVVAGRFDAEAVRARIETAFAPLPAGTPAALRDPADATVRGTLVMGDAPAAAAWAVPAPAPSEPLFPAFLVLAARLTGTSAQPRAWEATYDPLTRPETLFVTGARDPAEQPESAADRIRGETAPLLARPLTPGDIAAAREQFGLFLGLHALDPAICTQDPRAFALARARRAQLELGEQPLAQSLEATTEEQLEEAATLFAPNRTAAVIAGGTIR